MEIIAKVIVAVNVATREAILTGKNKDKNNQEIKTRDWAIVVTDLENFTLMSEALEKDSLIVMGYYLKVITEEVKKFNGELFASTGDGGIFCFDGKNKEENALKAALAMLNATKRLKFDDKWNNLVPNEAWKNYSNFFSRIGIHSGIVHTGKLGSEDDYAFTMIGDTINFAARLEGANKQYKTSVLVSQTIYERVSQELNSKLRQVDFACVKGKKIPKSFFTYDTDIIEDINYYAFRKAYDLAFAEYIIGDWTLAKKHFELALSFWENEYVAVSILNEINQLKETPPQGWQGYRTLDKK